MANQKPRKQTKQPDNVDRFITDKPWLLIVGAALGVLAIVFSGLAEKIYMLVLSKEPDAAVGVVVNGGIPLASGPLFTTAVLCFFAGAIPGVLLVMFAVFLYLKIKGHRG